MASLLLDLAGRVPAVANTLTARRRATSGESRKIAASIRRDLKAFRRFSPWPDFESVQEPLAQLRDAGAADAVLELAPRRLQGRSRHCPRQAPSASSGW